MNAPHPTHHPAQAPSSPDEAATALEALGHAGIAFIGGGNMASAIVAGLRRRGVAAERISVIDPSEAARTGLADAHGVATYADAASASAALRAAGLAVWAVKPQVFANVAAATQPHLAAGDGAGALHVSVMAGVRVAALASAIGSPRIVRSMPNTPALIGQGITGLFAPPAVGEAERAMAQALMQAVGQCLWVGSEGLLDAVTAVSGSGPAYVFYLLEAMAQAGQEVGLTPEQALTLTLQTVAGAAALAAASDEPLAQLRQRVTSPGGTTAAAIEVLDQRSVGAAVRDAVRAAAKRSQVLGEG